MLSCHGVRRPAQVFLAGTEPARYRLQQRAPLRMGGRKLRWEGGRQLREGGRQGQPGLRDSLVGGARGGRGEAEGGPRDLAVLGWGGEGGTGGEGGEEVRMEGVRVGRG